MCATPGPVGRSPQGAGMAEPYLALIAWTMWRAMTRCVDALGCTPSHVKANPNGAPEHAALKLGKGATCVGIKRSESSVGLGSRYAQFFAVAWLAKNAL